MNVGRLRLGLIEMAKCPGSDLRFVTAKDVACPRCGTPVELFSDESKRRCPSCGFRVARPDASSCAAWCESARACLGEKRYRELLGSDADDASPEADGASSD